MRRLAAFGTILWAVGAVVLPATAMGETSILRGYSSHTELLLGTKISVSLTVTGKNHGSPSICGVYEGTEDEQSDFGYIVGFSLKSLKRCRKHEYVGDYLVVRAEPAGVERAPIVLLVGHGLLKAAPCKWKLGEFGAVGDYAPEPPYRYLLAHNTAGAPLYNEFEVSAKKKSCGTLDVEAVVSMSLPNGELIEVRLPS